MDAKQFHGLPAEAREAIIQAIASLNVITFELNLIHRRGCEAIPEGLRRIDSAVFSATEALRDYTGLRVDELTSRRSE